MVLASFASLLGCAIAVGALLGLAERPNGSTSFDQSITSWVVTHRAHGWTTLARWLSTVGSQKVLAPLAVLVILALLVRRRRVSAAFLFLAWGGGIVLYSIVKPVVDRHRPPMDIWLTSASGASFPSGHATQSVAALLGLAIVGALWAPRARVPLAVLAAVLTAGIGWSRVYLGVHWTTDVVAGWLLGAAWVGVLIGLKPAAERIGLGPERAPGGVGRTSAHER